ncbi:MAG TPA: glycosyltransferase, partial [Pirellulales bacterium]
MFRIFIGWDSRFPEPADVLAYSLRKHSSIPLDIKYLKLNDLKMNRTYDPLASTEFTYSRFLPPHLCNFRGTALFLDNDMLCLADIAEIAALDMKNYSLRVVKHEY